MKTALRLFLVPGFILCVVLCTHAFAAQKTLSQESMTAVVNDSQMYDLLANVITESARDESGDELPIAVTGTQLRTILSPVAKQSISYITGTTKEPPSVSIDSIISQVFTNNPEMIEEFTAMKTEFATMKSEDGTAIALSDEQNPGTSATAGITSQLRLLRGMYSTLGYLPWVFLGLAIVGLLCILLLCPTMKSRAMWVAVLHFLAAIVLGVGIVVDGILQSSVLSIGDTGAAAVTEALIHAFAQPFLVFLVRWNTAGAIVCICIAVIALLARMMLFHTPHAVHAERKEKKSMK